VPATDLVAALPLGAPRCVARAVARTTTRLVARAGTQAQGAERGPDLAVGGAALGEAARDLGIGELLEPAVERCARSDDPLTALERESVKVSLENLRAFPFIAEAIQTRGLKLEGARFGVADGRLEVLDQTTGAFQFVT
jgi:hypothetical protein